MRCQEIQILSDGRAQFSQTRQAHFPENGKLGGLWCEEFQYERRGGIEEIHIITEGESQLNWRVQTLSQASAKVYQARQLESAMCSGWGGG